MLAEDDATHRQFVKRFAPPMALYLALLMGLMPYIREASTPWVGVLLALLPLLALAWAMVELVRHVRSLDEMQRHQHFEAGGIAGLVTCVLVFSWSFMEMAGLPRLPAVLVLPLFCGLYSVRFWQLTRRSR